MAEFSLTIVGLNYRLNKIERAQLSKLIEKEEGVPCVLELEPRNEVDPKAVKVVVASKHMNFSGRHIGYIRRPVNEKMFDLIRSGAEIKVALLDWVDVDAGEGELQIATYLPRK